jgi:hypothetical protein
MIDWHSPGSHMTDWHSPAGSHMIDWHPPGQGNAKKVSNFLEPIPAPTYLAQNTGQDGPKHVVPTAVGPCMPLLLPGVGLRLAASFRGQTRPPALLWTAWQ